MIKSPHKLRHEAIHIAALTAYLTYYCQDLLYQKPLLGALRARNWNKVIEVAREAKRELSSMGTWTDWGTTEAVFSPLSAQKMGKLYQIVAMVLKYPYDQDQLPGLDPDLEAIRGFIADERRNRRVNAVLRAYRIRDRVRHPAHASMRQWISEVIGEKPDLGKIYRLCDFSSGASIGVHGKATHFGNKVAKPLTSTPTALKYFVQAVLQNEQLHLFYSSRINGERVERGFDTVCLATPGELRDYFEENVMLVQQDLLSCAAKEFDRSRTVGTPPTCNTFIQKGTDNFLRQRLKDRANLDLAKQDVNQWMAREGATSGGYEIPYVTLDAKGASNSVLTEVVRLLTSEEWFSFLNETRSPGCIIKQEDGRLIEHRYELFASMGNGFCFPLETLIFSSACVAACNIAGSPVDFRVYGDDIIVRQDVALLVCEILGSLGFRLNLDKSFIFGPFRESCGANWHEDTDVTPVYWRNRITTQRELHAIHNAHQAHPEVQEALRGFLPLEFCVDVDDPRYNFVTDQGFRVSKDLCMGNGAVWRRDTQSFRYRLLRTVPVPDQAVPTDSSWERLRCISALRGSTFETAFLLRRSTRAVPDKPIGTESECNFSRHRVRRRNGAAWLAHEELCGPPVRLQTPWVEAVLRMCLTEVSGPSFVRNGL